VIPAERRNLIAEMLARRGLISIADLVAMLGVSHMTVRRDIQELERRGRARAIAGGVELVERLTRDAPHRDKAGQNHAQKLAIGRRAAELVSPNGIIYLDAGTTTLELTRALAERSDLTVVTNDFVIADFLAANSSCRLYHTGGEIDRDNRSSMGEPAAATIRRFNFDIAFISTTSFDARGLSSPDEGKSAVKRACSECARRRVLVTDSSKYGKVAAFHSLGLDSLSAIVTDAGLPESARRALEENYVEIIIA
jgi:DeoR/GlpR family transcriptional regulator of sugar metabolism